MLEVEHVSAGYGLVQILWDVSFTIKEKEIVSIIGPNGAGKTTLVKTIAGLPKLSRCDLAAHVRVNSRRYFLQNGHPLVTDARPTPGGALIAHKGR